MNFGALVPTVPAWVVAIDWFSVLAVAGHSSEELRRSAKINLKPKAVEARANQTYA